MVPPKRSSVSLVYRLCESDVEGGRAVCVVYNLVVTLVGCHWSSKVSVYDWFLCEIGGDEQACVCLCGCVSAGGLYFVSPQVVLLFVE